MHDPTNPLPEVPLSEKETIDLAVGPEPKRYSWLIDRNPMFLISGVLMLAGCFLVSGSIHTFDPIEVGESAVLMMLLGLLAVLNVYEFAVIWLGLKLAKTQTLVRDSRHLLGLALLLVVDAAFVYTETSIFAPRIGAMIAAFATLLACGKAWWIVRSLGIHPTRSAMAVTVTTLAAMYALPIGVRAMASDGFLSQPFALIVWIGLGLVVALHALPMRWVRFEGEPNPDLRQLQRLVVGGLIGLPLISLIGHAAAALWVYENAFEPSMTSPLLLALAALLLRHHRILGGPQASAKAASIVVACAVMPCLLAADGLTAVSSHYSWIAISPLRGVLLVSPLLLGWAWWISGRGPVGAAITVSPWIAAALGHTPSAMVRHLKWLIDSIAHLLPRTQMQWGALAITAAFVCLGIGGLISWRRHTRDLSIPPSLPAGVD